MESCIFCQIVAGVLPSTKRYEDAEFLAFDSISPVAPIHVVVIPKKHLDSLAVAQSADATILGKLLLAVNETAKKIGLKDYRISMNNGKFQEILHIHYHLLGGLEKGGI